ncbi:hypothetical protein SEA_PAULODIABOLI_320 [Microbacterium phage PauloDiaboli]|nr:hypothetical protein SEA_PAULODIABOLI_320 [Microbacterium phage PauloDiaboli]
MTDFQVGDKVRARGKHFDDKATFIVTEVRVDYDYSFELKAEGFILSSEEFEFTLIERPIKLPTTAGIYGFTNGAGMKLLLTSKGEWYWIDFTAYGADRVIRDRGPIPLEEIRDQFRNSDIILNYEYKVRS